MSDKPEALRLADALRQPWWYVTEHDTNCAAAELRRLHAECERLNALAGPGGKSLGALERINDGLCAENERLRSALQEADTLMGHEDQYTEWRERWAHLWPAAPTEQKP